CRLDRALGGGSVRVPGSSRGTADAENAEGTERRGELLYGQAFVHRLWITARESEVSFGGTAPAAGVLPTRAEPEAREQFPQITRSFPYLDPRTGPRFSLPQ